MKICIVAAGLATRLQPLTNHIPKFLINIGKQTGLVEMVRYWSEHSEDITIILHPKFEELTRAYFEMYFKDTNIKLTIKTCETALGTAHTIDTALGKDYNGDDILFTWSDVIPSHKFTQTELVNSTKNSDGISVFTVDNGLNRYKYIHNSLIKADDGNVIGIYYIRGYHSSNMQYEEGQDFADVLAKKFVNQFQLDDIIDFGDKPKLFEVLKSADEGREFNKVDIMEKLVHKSALNEQGLCLIKKEIDWYNEVYNGKANISVPKVFPSLDHDEFIMERVDGVSIFKVFSDVPRASQSLIVKGIVDNLKVLHSLKKSMYHDEVLHDIKKEALDKLLNRYDEIEGVIQAFGKNITKVNGIDIVNDPRMIINKLYHRIAEFYTNTNEYSLIHGDLQMSNSMVNLSNHKVTFIDPRGYFGDTKNYGLPDYDYAKFLYSLSGYDLFNNSSSFHLTDITDTEIEFNIPRPTVHDFPKFSEVQWLWLAVCWIGLAQYIRNNPIKSVAAHYHGLALATKFLNKKFTL